MTRKEKLGDSETNVEDSVVYDVVVIGAGLSGTVVASQAHKAGLRVKVFDKARGSGGRLSSKRFQISQSAEMQSFDLGCGVLKAETTEFQEQLREWEQEGVLNKFESEKKQDKYCPRSRSSSLTRYLLGDVDVSFGKRIVKIEKFDGIWHCYIEVEGEHVLSARSKVLVMAIPPKQAADLVTPDSAYFRTLEQVSMLPQWKVLLATNTELRTPSDDDSGERVGIIESITNDSLKPGRNIPEDVYLWAVHMTSDWSHENSEARPEEVIGVVEELLLNDRQSEMRNEASNTEIGNIEASNILFKHAHFWRYATVGDPLRTKNGVMSIEDGLYVCGDWLQQDDNFIQDLDGVEAAYWSGRRLARHITESH